MKFRPQLKMAAWGVSLALTAGLAAMPAFADPWGEASQGDSGYGVNTVMGDKINPRGLNTTTPSDDNGLGPFHTPVAHTPTGQLYSVPWAEPDDPNFYGSLEFGFIGTFGDTNAAKYQEYGSPRAFDGHNGIGITNFNLYTEKNGKYFTVSGGDVGLSDQYYSGAVGTYNDWRLRFFYNEIPHVYATNVKSIWDESTLGSTYLRLKQPLQYTANAVTGAQTDNNAQLNGTGVGSIASVVNSSDDATLKITRKRAGIRFDQRVSSDWSFFGDYSQERRTGDMPFSQTGGGFPANSTNPAVASNGQPINVVAPIDYTQRDTALGVAFSGKHDLLNLSLVASLFNDADRNVYWENPFDAPVSGQSADAYGNTVENRHVQEFSMYPNNQAYYVKGDYTHLFSFWDSSFSANAQYGWLNNHTPLNTTTSASGVVGGGAATPGSDMSYWNSLIGPNGVQTLSRLNTDINNTNYVMNFTYSLHPVEKLSLGLNARFYAYNDNNDYLACNPSAAAALGVAGACDNPSLAGTNTGIFGFVAEDGNGANGTTPSGASAIFDEKVRSFDTTYTQKDFGARADYALTNKISLNANLTDQLVDRSERERSFTREPRLKIGLTDRGLGAGTLRLSYEYANRTGSAYRAAAFMQSYCADYYTNYASCVNSFLNVDSGFPLGSAANGATSDYPIAGTKPDTDDRRENIIIARYNYMFTDTLDGMLNGKFKSDYYPDPYGRDARREGTLTAELNWQPTTTTGAYASLSYQNANQGQSSLNMTIFGGQGTCVDMNCTTTIGGPDSIWGQNLAGLTAFHYNLVDRNWFLNAGGNHVLSWGRFDANFTYEHTATAIGYNTYTVGADGITEAAAIATAQFPAQVWNRYQLNLNLTVPVNKNLGVRLAYMFDRAVAADWHYDGLSNYNDAPAGTYYLTGTNPDGGYTVNSIMLLAQYKM